MFVKNSYVKELLGELVEDDPRERGYSCFNIVFIKPNEGAGNTFYPLREGLYGGQTVGLGDNQRMNLDKNSVIVIHGGGVYGDKMVTIERWCKQFYDLPQNVQQRLVIENCEKNFFCESLS